MKTSAKKSAFTLVEMLAVVLIIGILVTIIVGVAGSVIQKANLKKTVLTMQIIKNAISSYYEDTKTYPPGAPTLLLPSVLNASPGAVRVLAGLPPDAKDSSGTMFLDGYGAPMRYYRSGGAGNFPYLVSAGADGTFDTADDIRSDNN